MFHKDANDIMLDFNPRPREGGDEVVEHRVVLLRISIHAPVKGATGSCARGHTSTPTFQSTPP